MSRRLALIAALCAFGCEDTYLREHIIDNFVCVYMPWWMGECNGEEVTAKVMGVLDHGLIEAQIDCHGTWSRTTSPFDTVSPSFKAQKLIDGSCFTTSNVSIPTLIARSEAGVSTCSRTSGGSTMYVEAGMLVFQATSSPLDRFECAVETCCTGFNLAAFGVEE